jgi:hypothetical protein
MIYSWQSARKEARDRQDSRLKYLLPSPPSGTVFWSSSVTGACTADLLIPPRHKEQTAVCNKEPVLVAVSAYSPVTNVIRMV